MSQYLTWKANVIDNDDSLDTTMKTFDVGDIAYFFWGCFEIYRWRKKGFKILTFSPDIKNFEINELNDIMHGRALE